jgi:hypothetical protein
MRPTLVSAMPSLNPLGIIGLIQNWWDGLRRLDFTLASWEWVRQAESSGPALRVRVVNKGKRPLRVRDAGTIHQGPSGGYLNATRVEGVPLHLEDSEDGELLITLLDHERLGLPPPVRVWVGLSTGERFDAEFPPPPNWSTGDNVNGDF